MLQGSPEWFYAKSQTKEIYEFCETIENLREKFIDRFSAEKLSAMDGKELLSKIFGPSHTSMMRLLVAEKSDYYLFGWPGDYAYTGIVYYTEDGVWKYYDGTNAYVLSEYEAEAKAKEVRDTLLYFVEQIESIGVFETIADYVELQNRLSKVPFYKYAWVLKYYQMLFPQFFPGMYADKTLKRAIKIVGLPYHGTANRLLNAGEVSLFIRRCDVNNIGFNKIYADEWTWEGSKPPCENATKNYEESASPIKGVNIGYYQTPSGYSAKRKERAKKAEIIEREINALHVEGKEKEAIVRVRVNQGEFRNRLLKRYDRCCLCGVENPALLIASHIKPWSVSEPSERLDENNGLLLCPNHDKLFDSFLISFDDTGKILISDELSQFDRMFMNVNDGMKIKIDNEQKKYLSYHRKQFYSK